MSFDDKWRFVALLFGRFKQFLSLFARLVVADAHFKIGRFKIDINIITRQELPGTVSGVFGGLLKRRKPADESRAFWSVRSSGWVACR